MSKKLSAASLTARLNEAVALLNSGALDRAADALRAILKDAPRDPNGLHLLGRTLSHLGQPQDAIPLIEAALKEMPNFAEAHFSLAVAHQQCGQHDRAITHFRQCLTLTPGQAPTLAGLGLSLRRLGQPADAANALAEAVRLLPGQADWHLSLAETLVDQERMADAIPQYREAIALGRRDAPVWNNLGMALKAEGEFDAAEHAYQQALDQQPNFPQALNNLGSLWRTRGREDQAFRCFQRATNLAPDFADAHFNQAIILVARHQMDEADAAFRRACALAPHRLDWLEQFAAFLITRKQPAEAEIILTRIAETGNTPKAWLDVAGLRLVLGQKDETRALMRQWLPAINDKQGLEIFTRWSQFRDLFSPDLDLASIFLNLDIESKTILLIEASLHLGNFIRTRDTKDLDKGLAATRKALKLAPEDSNALCMLGAFYAESGKSEQAFEAFKSSIDRDDENFYAHLRYGLILKKLRRISDAIFHFRRAMEINPDDGKSNNNLGITLIDIGEMEEGFHLLKKSIGSDLMTSTFYSNMIFMMHFSDQFDRDALFAEAQSYQRHFAVSLLPATLSWQPTANDKDRPLRIGFVSCDFRSHVVNMFFEHVLKELRTYDAELHLFSNTADPDMASERLKAIAHYWHDIERLTDDQVIACIQQAGIDILVDMSGHTAGNRLLVFARKPVPVQISWLGYFSTTGLTTMDYILGDPICTPPELDPWFTERVYRLPDDFVCYAPPAEAPPIKPLPALNQGRVTFFSANQLPKITEPVIDLWCNLLQRVPNSRLALRTMSLTDPKIAAMVINRFVARGIDADRLDFTGGGKSIDILNFYANHADIALDPFPCVGGTTTCEALWMGVPVVTLLGDRFAGRHSASHLTNVGVPELVATTPEHYLEIAIGLANDLPRLADLRARLRPMMAASPLCDAPRFAANLMQAFRHCWQDAVTRRQQA